MVSAATAVPQQPPEQTQQTDPSTEKKHQLKKENPPPQQHGDSWPQQHSLRTLDLPFHLPSWTSLKKQSGRHLSPLACATESLQQHSPSSNLAGLATTPHVMKKKRGVAARTKKQNQQQQRLLEDGGAQLSHQGNGEVEQPQLGGAPHHLPWMTRNLLKKPSLALNKRQPQQQGDRTAHHVPLEYP
ncbi:unnamed protein product [Closterium sp. Naga37s-1]|nr:unnamed protein product [Closterium sp. Naga37s-1]CAI5503885.1 unnamed protein product [Closterium sp. Naga37s-1]